MAASSRREARVDQIIAGAAQFFSENGLSGQTRELAKFLGIAQPLLYRYFPSKRSLIERIFEEFFENRWNSNWPTLIRNDSLSIETRLRRLYSEYNQLLLTREWVRLFMFAELAGYGFGKKSLAKLTQEILVPLATCLRKHYGAPDTTLHEITAYEINLLLDLHGLIIYKSIRKHVYGMRSSAKWSTILDDLILHLQGSMPAVYQRIFPGFKLKGTPRPLSVL
jgi:AcrR family transcriptional regulator